MRIRGRFGNAGEGDEPKPTTNEALTFIQLRALRLHHGNGTKAAQPTLKGAGRVEGAGLAPEHEAGRMEVEIFP